MSERTVGEFLLPYVVQKSFVIATQVARDVAFRTARPPADPFKSLRDQRHDLNRQRVYATRRGA